MILSHDPWGVRPVRRGEVISVFAVDPGDTIGWTWCCLGAWERDFEIMAFGYGAHWLDVDDQLVGQQLIEMGRLRHGQMSALGTVAEPFFVSEPKMADRLLQFMVLSDHKTRQLTRGAYGLSHVIVEDFEVRMGTKGRSLLSPVRLATLITAGIAHPDFPAVDLMLQSASLGKVVDDDALRARGLWWSGEQHARDASRHLVTALRRMKSL